MVACSHWEVASIIVCMILLDTMNSFRVLVTCPPMLGMFDQFITPASKQGIELVATKVQQTLSERELIDLLPNFDGWIIGDDPATMNVFEAASSGSLRAAVKWVLVLTMWILMLVRS